MLSKISEAEWLDINLNSLEEAISPKNRTIILGEESDYIDFEKIIKSEYPKLSEQIDVVQLIKSVRPVPRRLVHLLPVIACFLLNHNNFCQSLYQ